MNKAVRSILAVTMLSLLISSVAYAFTYDQQTNSVGQTIMNVPYFYVDNNISNVDFSNDIGTHSNFTAQQDSPDSIYDNLLEGSESSQSLSWGIIDESGFTTSSAHLNYRYMGGTSPNIDNMNVTGLHLYYSGTGIAAIALYTGGALDDPTGAIKRTEAFNISVSTGWNDIDVPDYVWEKNTVTWVGVAHEGGSTLYSSSSADAGDFQSERGRYRDDSVADGDETGSMPTNPGSPGQWNNYWLAVHVEYEYPDDSNFELDLEVQWTNIDYTEANEELCIYVSEESAGSNNTHSLDATGGYMIIGDGTPDWGSTTGTISFWVKMDSTVQGRIYGQDGNMETRWSGTNLVLDWGATGSMTSATSFIADTWYFVAIVWDENNDNLSLYVGDQTNLPTLDANSLSGTWASITPIPTENRFMNGVGGAEPVDGHGDDLRYWNVSRSLVELQSDYNVTLSGSETNLRSYFRLNNDFDDIGPDNNDGSGSGSYSFSTDTPFTSTVTEDLRVDVWTGSGWQNLFTDLSNGWNNVTIASYLTSATFTVRFKGNTETNDIVQDSWNIDATVIHAWT